MLTPQEVELINLNHKLESTQGRGIAVLEEAIDLLCVGLKALHKGKTEITLERVEVALSLLKAEREKLKEEKAA